MEKTVECGEGGWTLAMKIDGHKVHEDDTFPESIGLPIPPLTHLTAQT